VVVVVFKTKGGHVLELRFSYVTMLHIVTVIPVFKLATELPIPTRDMLAPSVFLNCLFRNDCGVDTPNPANHYQLKRLGMDVFKNYIDELGYPYDWVQRAAGLDHAQELGKQDQERRTNIVPSSDVSFSHMEQIVRAVKERLVTRIALQKQLHNLETGVIPIDAKALSLFPTKIASRLKSFSSLTWEDFLLLPQAQRLVDSGLVDHFHFTFTAVIERGSAKLVAAIAVSPDYPKKHPIFLLSTTWKEGSTSLEDAALWDLEQEVNVHWEELLASGPSYLLLSNQMQRLLMCFDVYLESENIAEVVEGPREFAKEKFFLQQSRGRNRTKPYKYNPAMDLFVHR